MLLLLTVLRCGLPVFAAFIRLSFHCRINDENPLEKAARIAGTCLSLLLCCFCLFCSIVLPVSMY